MTKLKVKSETPRERKVKVKKENIRHYTIGQIFRLGLLKNWKGEPYKDQATVSRLVNRMSYVVADTVWGKAKVVSETELSRFINSRASHA